MKVTKTKLSGVLLIEPTIHEDSRGYFSEVFRSSILKDHGVSADFVQDNHVYSNDEGVLRGLHYQASPRAQDKLVRVVRGSIYDVVVDLRKESPTYGDWYAVVLSADNRIQLLVPKGFAHGYVTLEPTTEVVYKVTDYYAPEEDRGIIWNDVSLGIDWKLQGAVPIVSARDSELPKFDELAPVYWF